MFDLQGLKQETSRRGQQAESAQIIFFIVITVGTSNSTSSVYHVYVLLFRQENKSYTKQWVKL